MTVRTQATACQPSTPANITTTATAYMPTTPAYTTTTTQMAAVTSTREITTRHDSNTIHTCNKKASKQPHNACKPQP